MKQVQFLWILLATLFHNFIKIESKQCNVVQIQPNEILISQGLNALIIENDQEELQVQNYDQYKIISQSLRISNFVEEQIIYTQIVESFSFNSIDDKLFCIFIRSKAYHISCVKIYNLYSNQILNYQEKNKLFINMNNLNVSFCQEFFQNQEEQQFQVFCQKNNYLNIYSSDLDNNINLQLQYEIPQIQYKQCKRKVFQLDNHNYLISFYLCEDWGLYLYNNQEIKTFLNEQIALNSYEIQIKYLENIQICQKRLYLLIENGYHLFLIDHLQQFNYHMFQFGHQNLKSIILSEICMYVFSVLYDPSINKTQIWRPYHEVQFQFEGRLLNIQQIMGSLIVQTQHTLLVIFNFQLNQSIQINSTYVIFNDQYNLIYFHDEITNEIIFYKFSYPRNLIQPTKKYIFYVFNYFHFSQDVQTCREIQYIRQTNSKSILTLSLKNQCQNTQYLLYRKKDLELPNEYQIQIDKDYKFGIQISDQKSFLIICPNLNKVNNQETILFYYESNNQEFSVLQKNFQIYVQNCFDKPKFQINIEMCQVFSYQSSILLWCANKNTLRLVNFKTEKIKEIKLNSEITNIIQSKNSILIFTSRHLEILDMHYETQINLNQKIIRILKILNEIYLLDRLHIVPTFHYTKIYPQFIQYLQYLFFKINSKLTTLKLENIQVVFISEILHQQILIIGIHLNFNQIINYHYNNEQLLILYNLQIEDYEIIRPLNYQIYDLYLAIASRKQNKTFVLIFEIRLKRPLSLIKVFEISRIHFFFNLKMFFYYNSKDEITIFNLENFEIQLQNIIQQEIKDINNYEISFKIVSANQIDPIINIEFNLTIYNQCYELYQKKDYALLKYSSYQLQKIKISNFFHGPIDSIKILYDNATKIHGPLFLSEIISNQYIQDGIQVNIIKYPYVSIFSQLTILELLFYDHDQDRFIFYKQNNEIIKAIPIDKEQTLIVIYIGIYNLFKGEIYLIEKDSQNFIINKPQSSTNITLNENFGNIRIFKTGNLIVFQSQSQLILYVIINGTLKLVQPYLDILEIQKINGNNDQYITVSQSKAQVDYIFQIFSFIEDIFIFNGKVSLLQNQIQMEFKKYIYIEDNSLFYNQIKCQILENIIIEGNLKIIFFQTYAQYSILSHIEINLESYSIQFIPQKFIRNGIEQDQVTLEFYNQHILILKSLQNVTYLYDLNEDSKFLDYIGKHIQNDYSYFPLNTTHFIIFSSSTGQIFQSEIGYKFEFKDEIFINKTFTLVVQNSVSQANCDITILNDINLNEENHFLKYILLIVLALFFCYFVIRRMQLKRKQLNNLRQSRSFQEDSRGNSQCKELRV